MAAALRAPGATAARSQHCHDGVEAAEDHRHDRHDPQAIQAEGAKAGLKDVSYPTCDVAGQAIDTGSKARCFAQYMNIHALEATGGYVYAAMGAVTVAKRTFARGPLRFSAGPRGG
jgi:hypothetical protein